MFNAIGTRATRERLRPVGLPKLVAPGHRWIGNIGVLHSRNKGLRYFACVAYDGRARVLCTCRAAPPLTSLPPRYNERHEP